MFYLFKMPKRRTFGHFLTSSENKLFFIKRRTCLPKRGRMVALVKVLFLLKLQIVFVLLLMSGVRTGLSFRDSSRVKLLPHKHVNSSRVF